MTLRQRIARRLRFLADRIDRAGSLAPTAWRFTYEDNDGRGGPRLRLDGRGCEIWLRRSEEERAFTDSDTEYIRSDWAAYLIRQARVRGEVEEMMP